MLGFAQGGRCEGGQWVAAVIKASMAGSGRVMELFVSDIRPLAMRRIAR